MKRMTIATATALILGALALAGCGGSGAGGTTESSTVASTSSGGPQRVGIQISAAAKKCLKEKGVEPPEPGTGGTGPQTFQKGEAPEGGQLPEGAGPPAGTEPPEAGALPQGGPPSGAAGGPMNEETKEAFEECGVQMPEFKTDSAGPGGPNVNSAVFRKQVKEYVACVRENGFELAEPDFSGEGPIFDRAESESAAFKKASAKCQKHLSGP